MQHVQRSCQRNLGCFGFLVESKRQLTPTRQIETRDLSHANPSNIEEPPLVFVLGPSFQTAPMPPSPSRPHPTHRPAARICIFSWRPRGWRWTPPTPCRPSWPSQVQRWGRVRGVWSGPGGGGKMEKRGGLGERGRSVGVIGSNVVIQRFNTLV